VKPWHEKWWISGGLGFLLSTIVSLIYLPSNSIEEEKIVIQTKKASAQQLINTPSNSEISPKTTIADSPKSKNYTLPKEVIRLIDPALFHGTSSISSTLGQKLGITPEQVDQLNSVLDNSLVAMYDREAQLATLKMDKKGNQFFEISPYDSDDIQSTIRNGFFKILADDRANLLLDMMTNSTSFGFFGRYPQEISFTEVPELNNETQLEVKFKHNVAGLSSGYTLALGAPGDLEKRFGKIYQKFGLSLYDKKQP